MDCRVIVFLGWLCTVIVHSRGKILRFGYKFFARFTLIDGNSRLTSDNAISVAEKVTLLMCQYECMKEKTCQTINHNEDEEKCELLDVTKFDHPNALQRDFKWKHYETNDDANNIGDICEKLSPCKAHEVCEDTYRHPPYVCRCRDGFEGENCDVYKGPGYDSTIPASSCRALFARFKLIPDGLYWIKNLKKQVNCTRRVDGGYSPWSAYGSCSTFCERGVQVRKRTCTQPAPKGGGQTCRRLGEDTQTKECPFLKCDCSAALKNGKSNINLTIENLSEQVECGRIENHSVTYFSHDAERLYHFHPLNPVRSRNIIYVNTIEFVTKAVSTFGNCTQRFHVESVRQHPLDCSFESARKEKLDATNVDCINCDILFKNDQLDLIRGFGFITNKTFLPVVKMTFIDTDDPHEYVKIKLDKLMCW